MRNVTFDHYGWILNGWSILVFKLRVFIKSYIEDCNTILEVHSYKTRHNQHIYNNFQKLKRGQKFPHYTGCTLYNNLPRELCNLALPNFKYVQRQILIEIHFITGQSLKN